MRSVRIELLSELAAINEKDWDQVLASSPTRTIFQTMAWQRAWWETFGRGKLLLIAVYEDDQLKATAPLFADEGMVFFVGSGGSDYLDFMGEAYRPRVLREILELARTNTPEFVGFRFYHVPDGSPTHRSLVATAPEIDLTCFDEGSFDAPTLRFADWPASRRFPSDKKSLLRHERAMRKLGSVDIDHFCEHARIEPLLAAFFAQHIKRWAGTPFPSLFLDGKQRAFYHKLSEFVSSRGWLRFTRVSLDNEPVAFHFGFLFQNAFLWYKPCFDINGAHQSPGEVLLRALLLQSREEGAEVFDFGLGDEPFKSRFATRVDKVRTWGLYPCGQVCGSSIEVSNRCKFS